MENLRLESYRLKFLLIFAGFGILISAGAYGLLYWNAASGLEKEFAQAAVRTIDERSALLRNGLEEEKRLLDGILLNDAFRRYVESGGAEEQEEARRLFLTLAATRPRIFQLRFLCPAGNEKIRVDRTQSGSTPFLVPREELQVKKERYYFTKTAQLPDGAFYFSRLDLNVEEGKIQTPRTPVLRIARPFYTDGVFRGVLVVNLFMQETLKELASTGIFDLFLYDGEGSVLLHPDASRNWSRQLGTGHTLAQDFPETEGAVGKQRAGREIYIRRLAIPLDGGLIMALRLNKEVAAFRKNEAASSAFGVAALLLLLSIPLAFAAAVIPERLYRQLIRRSEELARSLALIDKHIIYSKTDKRGIITDASQAFCQISGYPKEELVGRPHSVIRHPDNPPEFFREIWETIRNGESWQGEIKNLRKDGSEYVVISTISPEKDENGEIRGYVSIRQDVTAKRKVAEQRRQMLVQSRHAAMGEMISIIAHQWRQPINALSIILYQLLDEGSGDRPDPKKLEEFYGKGEALIMEMSATIDDFKDFFKENKRKHRVSVKEVVDSALKLLEHMMKNREIRTENRIDPGLQTEVVENELKQLMINLLTNAADQLKTVEGERAIRIEGGREEGAAYLAVADNGGGIPDPVMPRIFDPYFSTKAEHGTGMGLYMCKMIVEESMGGSITAENAGGGARFTIRMPRSGKETKENADVLPQP